MPSADPILEDQAAAALVTLLAAARLGGEAALADFRLGEQTRAEIAYKPGDSPVTSADLAVDRTLEPILRAAFPDAGWLSEETADGPERLNKSGLVVLDPIDGTRAFISGRPTFGTLIALFQDNRPIIGVIDQPVTGERWIGALDRKTIFRGPLGGAAGCRPCPSLSDAELSCTSPEMFGADMPRFERLRQAVRRNYWGGDCYAHGLVALGQIDIVAECDNKVWDWGALVPVIEGAGGSVTDWQGRALRPNGDGRVLSVGDKTLLPAILRELNLSPVASA
jgi:histidinol phosphatase-like enzyme (inositol monophosphatase family)